MVTTDFARNAPGATPAVTWTAAAARLGPAGAALARAQTAEEVAAGVAELIAAPRAELYTNPGAPEVARRYVEDVEAFERALYP
jgi:hypothetical protein